MPIDNNIMDWNDTLESDGQEFIVLPEGDYAFTVTGFERGHFPGSAKIPPCNKATLTVRIDNDLGAATARFDLILYRTMEWKIAAFFRCIGQKKKGEKMTPDWNQVLGGRGWAHFKPRTYIKNSQERQVNDVDHFYDYDPCMDFIPADDEELPWDNGGN